MRFFKKDLFLLYALVGMLVSCGGEETTTEVMQSSYATMDIYESSRNLPECDLANNNQQVFVKEDSSLRVCSGKVWQKVSVTEYYTNVSCYMVPLRGSRGYKVICNGDSVGVIQNGSDGTRGGNGTGCSIRYEDDLERSVIVCGTDSVIVDFPLADTSKYKDVPVDTSVEVPVVPDDTIPADTIETPADTIPADTMEIPVDTIPVDTMDVPVDTIPADTVEIPIDTIPADTVGIDSVEEVENDSAMAISMDSLGGYSQKGPFVKGSMVYMYELQDGRTLKQTNGNFVSRIDSDDGHFKFVARNLVSQYVLMQATGYYLNEVTNQRTTEMITLNGIVDVSKRSTANINVLTHLEYPRVNYLVTVEKKRFKDAKKQAREEILNAFHIDSTAVGDFEDMDVLENGLLRSVSILLQGNLTVAQLTERLSKIAVDLEKDGSWDDAEMRAEIADWAIKSVIELGEYGIGFWYVEYGLSKPENEGGIFIAHNEYGIYDGKAFKYKWNAFSLASATDVYVGKACVLLDDMGFYANEFWKWTFECSYSDYDGFGWHLAEKTPAETMETMTDPRDGKTYGVVTIGNQTWMAENLNYADSVAYPSLWKKSGCIFERDSSDCRLYGRGYTWSAVMDSVNTGCGDKSPCSVDFPVQGICPDGWHLPDTTEIRELFNFVESDSPDISLEKALMSIFYEFDVGENGIDKYGFNLLPSALNFWTSTGHGDNNAYSAGYDQDGRLIYYIGLFVSQSYALKKNVRCVKNKD